MLKAGSMAISGSIGGTYHIFLAYLYKGYVRLRTVPPRIGSWRSPLQTAWSPRMNLTTSEDP